jgi:hypothetical protein
MKKIFLLVFLVIQFVNVYSQSYYEQVDSVINKYSLKDNDWVSALFVNWPSFYSRYDSLGNNIDNEPDGAYIFTKINNLYALQRVYTTFIGESFVAKVNPPVTILNVNICNYNKDSILKAEREWICPYIYKNDSLNVYNLQGQATHSPSYNVTFRTKESKFFSSFNDIDLVDSSNFKFFSIPKNLNYNHNINTFIYRIFMSFSSFLRDKYQIEILSSLWSEKNN